MTIVTIQEIVDLIIMTLAIGFIFSNVFRAPQPENYDPLKAYLNKKRFNLDDFKLAAMVAAPAIILHELAHKFVALSFGINAVFHAAYTWLAVGVVLKLLNFGFIFFIPGYVSYLGSDGTALQRAILSVAGPLMNLLLFLIAAYLIGKVKDARWKAILYMTRQINLFLFIFNMLPIPPFDGWHFVSNLLQAF